MNKTYILLSCVDKAYMGAAGMCQNVSAVKTALAAQEPLFWQWIRMWF